MHHLQHHLHANAVRKLGQVDGRVQRCLCLQQEVRPAQDKHEVFVGLKLKQKDGRVRHKLCVQQECEQRHCKHLCAGHTWFIHATNSCSPPR